MNEIKEKALRHLARREHSVAELRYKLVQTDFHEHACDEILVELQEANLLSDQRFSEMMVRSCINKGHGPCRILQNLKQKGVASDVIEQAIASSDQDWSELAIRVYQKKFGDAWPDDYGLREKRKAFLQYRGFSSEQIKEMVSSIKEIS